MSEWELAQVNIALPTVPLSEPELAWFVEALEPVNAAVDAASGFRWRLQTEDGDHAQYLRTWARESQGAMFAEAWVNAVATVP